MMKKLCAWLMMLSLLCPTVTLAEVSPDDGLRLSNTLLATVQWDNWLTERKASGADDDESILTNMAQNILLLSQVLMLRAMDGAENLMENIGDLVVRPLTCSVSGKNLLCQMPVMWVDDMDVYATCDTVSRDDYLSAMYSLYQEDGTYLGTQRLEMARRDDTVLMLLVDYDNLMHLTGRFAARWQDGSPEILYTKTIGMNMDVVLDVSAWQSGEELSVWDSSLLRPAH